MAVASYATYLFHEIVLSIARTALEFLAIGGLYSDILMVIIAFPAVFIVGYLTQSTWSLAGKAIRNMGRPSAGLPGKHI